MISEPASAQGFSPEPEHGALLTGLLELVASDSIPADRLANLAAARLAEGVGDAYVVSLLAGGGRVLQPVAMVDADPAATSLLVGLVDSPVTPGRRPELGPYVARFGLASEMIAPMRARGRVVGEVVALRRGQSPPFTPPERQLIQAVADLVALGLDDRRLPIPPADVPAPDNLTRREREILALLALGHTNREIAEQVRLSVRTVEWHRARIQTKLRVTGRAALAQVARAHGLLAGTDREPEE